MSPFRISRRLLPVLLALGAGLSARAQLLKMGPINTGLGLNLGFSYTSNYDGIPDGEVLPPGQEKEDFYLTYGMTLSGSTRIYPNIDMTLSSSISREKHFIQDEPVEDDVPLLGNTVFSFNRTRGHYGFNLGLQHNADTDYKREEVFVPAGRRKARDLTQTSSAIVGLNWSYSPFMYSLGYNYMRERHSKDFQDGDQDTQAVNGSFSYRIIKTVSARATYDRTKEDVLNIEGDPSDNVWEETVFVGFDIDILQRPTLRYTVGGEREDDLGEKGEWEPVHTVTFVDTRQVTPALNVSINANYSFEREQETDDVTFTYGAQANHKLPYQFNQTLSATREPVSTFGSTSETDSTTWSYSLTHPSFFLRELAMNFSVTLADDKPQGPTPAPEEQTLTYNLTFSRSVRFSQKWSGILLYSYILEDRELQGETTVNETIPEHRVDLTFTYTVF